MRGREGDVALGIALGASPVQPVDRPAGDEIDAHAGLGREFLGNCLCDEIAPTAAQILTTSFVLRLDGRRTSRAKAQAKTEPYRIPLAMLTASLDYFPAGAILHQQPVRTTLATNSSRRQWNL